MSQTPTARSSSKLAALGGQPVRSKDKAWPSWPTVEKGDEEALLRVLRSGKWGIGGAEADRFARLYCDWAGIKFGQPCVNGTVAIELALRAVGVLPKDEVIVPPYTFMATAAAPLAMGAVPVFVDIDADTYTLDPDLLEAAITPRTKAIIPVHIAGIVADMDRINAIAKKHGLAVVEDAAQAHGSTWQGKGVGGLADAGTFSFQSSKNLSSGEGGLVTTNDEGVYERAFSYGNCGRKRSGGEWYGHPMLGLNYRLTQFQAALLCSQFTRLQAQHAKRQENARYLSERLAAIDGIKVIGWPWPEKQTACSYHLFMLAVDPGVFGVKDAGPVGKAISAEGVQAGTGYHVPLQHYDFMKDPYIRRNQGDSGPDYDRTETPVCAQACKFTLWIYQSMLLAEKQDMDDIVAAVQKVRDNAAAVGQLEGKS